MFDAPKEYYVAQMLLLWSNIQTDAGLPFSVKMEDGTIGFLPVFETEEELKEAYPDTPYRTVRHRDPEEEE